AWKVHTYAWIIKPCQDAPMPRRAPRHSPYLLKSSRASTLDPRLDVEGQAYDWKQVNQLSSTPESTHKRGSPRGMRGSH
ncbi:hypothetical protein PIB30_079774, partial [Stylosanthes scabra]|nr:hypothetical protein [Stylosanthes scabra]